MPFFRFARAAAEEVATLAALALFISAVAVWAVILSGCR